MASNAALFASIAKDRVNAKQPPSSGDDLDVDRCAALHNQLLLYGWFCSGKKISAMEKRSWWGKHGNDSLKKILRPKVVRYLSKVFDVEGHNFFYHVSGLTSEKEMLQLADVLEDNDHDPVHKEKYRYIVLYKTSEALVSQPAGIVYDQQTGRALLMPTYHHLFDFSNAHMPWQKMESILSAYIDMIEAEKAVAIHDDAGKDDEGMHHPRQELEQNKMLARYKTRPWILQPYTLNDLYACLDIWRRLVHALETRAGVAHPINLDADDDEEEDYAPLCSTTALNVAGIPQGFAYQLLSHAQQSQVWFLAPGLRLPKVEEFLQQPFKKVLQQYPQETRGMKMPFLFLRCEGTVSAKEGKFRYPFSTVERVPCGLYLDAFPNAQNPFEDACRLVLPIKLGNNRYARTSDFRPIIRSHSDLYQTGVNPYVIRHGPKLVAVLENWLTQVESGHWSVNELGVSDNIEMWHQADTRANWWRYQSEHLFV
ncbi:hypothetical protein DOTSEDRAFT_71585 [Dothistroma septosporum NZE10]|uniref:Uncharacterized protein n=1 Tax=Dothistroma septosporum (strain NZE10 / CBS 128990) TaxID=675120 RepID=N1PN32_DOTSN|nr:hypothetical protein DOTSEDRAFT_71585 [Dothistroma septosporum NZE10]